jgi:hypothetical protein
MIEDEKVTRLSYTKFVNTGFGLIERLGWFNPQFLAVLIKPEDVEVLCHGRTSRIHLTLLAGTEVYPRGLWGDVQY